MKYLDKLFIIEGIVLAILGVLFFISPAESLLNFALICGILTIITGVLRIIRAFTSSSKMYYILTGIIDILFGILLATSPIFVVENVIIFLGVWALIRGIYTLIVIIKDGEFGFNLESILSIIGIILGAIIMFSPFIVVVILPFVPYILGLCFIVSAITEIYIGFKI